MRIVWRVMALFPVGDRWFVGAAVFYYNKISSWHGAMDEITSLVARS
jgi:hypothetical protein